MECGNTPAVLGGLAVEQIVIQQISTRLQVVQMTTMLMA
jgi:hypothetical protein